MTKRQPDSKAVAEARVELAAIVEDLRAAKARAVAIERRLKRAAKSAKPLGEIDGMPTTEEAWLAAGIGTCIDESLKTTIEDLSKEARGVSSRKLATAIALDAKRAAEHEAEVKRALDLFRVLTEPHDPLVHLEETRKTFIRLAYDLVWLRRCYVNTPEGELAWQQTLARRGFTPEAMDRACGGRY